MIPAPPLPPATLVKIEKIAKESAFRPACPVRMVWATRKDLNARYPEFRGTLNGVATADCVATVAVDLPADKACFVMVHELGHLAGKPHSGNPNSVMFSDPENGPLRCKLLMPENQPTRTGLRLTLKRDGEPKAVRYIKRCKFSRVISCGRFSADYFEGAWYWSMRYDD